MVNAVIRLGVVNCQQNWSGSWSPSRRTRKVTKHVFPLSAPTGCQLPVSGQSTPFTEYPVVILVAVSALPSPADRVQSLFTAVSPSDCARAARSAVLCDAVVIVTDILPRTRRCHALFRIRRYVAQPLLCLLPAGELRCAFKFIIFVFSSLFFFFLSLPARSPLHLS